MTTVSIPVTLCAEKEVHSISFNDEGNVWTNDHDWLDDTLVDLGLPRSMCMIQAEEVAKCINYSGGKYRDSHDTRVVFGAKVCSVLSMFCEYGNNCVTTTIPGVSIYIFDAIVKMVIDESSRYFTNEKYILSYNAVEYMLETMTSISSCAHGSFAMIGVKGRLDKLKSGVHRARELTKDPRKQSVFSLLLDLAFLASDLPEYVQAISTEKNGFNAIYSISKKLLDIPDSTWGTHGLFGLPYPDEVRTEQGDLALLFNMIIEEANRYTASVVTSPGDMR
jgi:hypothetical protein